MLLGAAYILPVCIIAKYLLTVRLFTSLLYQQYSGATVKMYHNYSKSMMVALAVAFMVLPFVFVCLRLWAKRIAKRVGWDDFLTVAALVREL